VCLQPRISTVLDGARRVCTKISDAEEEEEASQNPLQRHQSDPKRTSSKQIEWIMFTD